MRVQVPSVPHKKISTYTRNLRPLKLVFSQEFESIDIARKIERKLKKYKSRKIIENIITDKVIKLKN